MAYYSSINPFVLLLYSSVLSYRNFWTNSYFIVGLPGWSYQSKSIDSARLPQGVRCHYKRIRDETYILFYFLKFTVVFFAKNLLNVMVSLHLTEIIIGERPRTALLHIKCQPHGVKYIELQFRAIQFNFFTWMVVHHDLYVSKSFPSFSTTGQGLN